MVTVDPKLLPPNYHALKPRERVVAAWLWGVDHNAHFGYSQGSTRYSYIAHPFTIPPGGIFTDCSGWATTGYAWAGLPDPNQCHYGWGNTTTLVKAGHLIVATELEQADLVIYWDNPTLVGIAETSSHVAGVINDPGTGRVNTKDPLTVSMGQNGDPKRYRVSDDGRAHKFYRYLPTERPQTQAKGK